MNSTYKCNVEAGIGHAWFGENPPSTQTWIKQYLSWDCVRIGLLHSG